MIKKEHVLIFLLVIVILIFSIAIVNQISTPQTDGVSHNIEREVISNDTVNDKGSVEVIRNIGNPNSKKIA